MSYSLDIFRRADVKLNNYLLSILLQCCTLLGYIIAACIIPYVRRKYHFVLSAVGMGISQVVLGIALKFNVS